MPAPAYDAADFAQGLLRLLPTGRAWSREPDSVVAQVVGSQAPNYARLHARANVLLADAFPATAVELLPEWESALGLPDPCAGPDQTVAQRQAHVVARLTQSNGPSIPSLTAFAAALGYPCTIQEFAPSRFGRPFGRPFGGTAWAHTWQVSTTAVVVRPFIFGQGRFGDPFTTRGSDVLQCEMRRLAPAHTVLLFAFTGVTARWEQGGWDVDTWAA